MIENKYLNDNSKIIPLKELMEVAERGLTLLDQVEGEDDEYTILKYYVDALAPYVKDCVEKEEAGWPVVGHHFAFPAEILYFFDVVPVCVEAMSYAFAIIAQHGIESYIDNMEAYGSPFHTCSAQKGVLGMSLEKLFKFDLLATPSGPCDNTIASYPVFQYLQEQQKVKVLDVPYYRNDRSLDYFTVEITNFVDELADFLGQEPNEEKFKKAIEYENKNITLLRELNELKKACPCPVGSGVALLNATMNVALPARQERAIYYEKLLQYAKKYYKLGIKPNDNEEKIRSIWPNMCIYFKPKYANFLDRRRGVTILFDVFNYNFHDPINLNKDIDDIFKQLALQCLNYPMARQASGYANQMVEDTVFLSREYKADCAIFTNHISCKSLQPIVQLLREALRDELGIPLLSIDVDVGDKRVNPFRTIKKEVDTFLKTLF